MSNTHYEKPRWLRDLHRFLPLKSQFILSGNVRDLQTHEVSANVITAAPLMTVLAAELMGAGYAHISCYDPVSGLRAVEDQTGGSSSIQTDIDFAQGGSRESASHDVLAAALDRVVMFHADPIALVVDFASRLLIRNDAPSPTEHQLFTRALLLSQKAQARPSGQSRKPFFNTIIWIVDKEGDLPDWFIVGNPHIRHIPIAAPDRIARRAVASSVLRSLSGGRDASPESFKAAEGALVDNTEGLRLIDLNAIAQLARSEGVAFSSIDDAVRRYKVGVTDDPWRKIEAEKIRSATDFVRRRVIGQDHAVTHMLDIIKRAALGVGGARRGSRPRGVAFLAGPTGVGKTELAKTITQLLFGDESAYIRFDMSEFSAEHADQRLIGAPPGYVGYDVGGELTNAVREKPFSVVLFDEIEKAHPRILDKFLQILDDGVLTSGRGDRVYFSEALIVFTSNLGCYSIDAAGIRRANVSPGDPFEAVQQEIRTEIDAYFKVVLNRPEILNRIGENIIVFDFVRQDVAIQIFDQMIAALLVEVKQAGYSVALSALARNKLLALCLADLSNGGRGIRNQIDAHFLNPLARALFEYKDEKAEFTVEDIESGFATELKLSRSVGGI